MGRGGWVRSRCPRRTPDGIALAVPGLTGLLGSDVLYRFGTITVDCANSRLILHG